MLFSLLKSLPLLKLLLVPTLACCAGIAILRAAIHTSCAGCAICARHRKSVCCARTALRRNVLLAQAVLLVWVPTGRSKPLLLSVLLLPLLLQVELLLQSRVGADGWVAAVGERVLLGLLLVRCCWGRVDFSALHHGCASLFVLTCLLCLHLRGLLLLA